MADTAIPDLTELTTIADTDKLYVTDSSDTTDSSDGTSKFIQKSNLVSGLASSGANSDITSLTGLTTALSVSQGGTGAKTHTSGKVLVGAGTSAVTTTKAAPTGGFIGTTDSQTLTNKTIDASKNTLSNITTAMLSAVSGADTTVITGTAGTASDLSIWNADGDLVDGPTPPSGTIVGISDTQTLTNKRIDKRITTITSNATPTVNTDNCDAVTITALATNITSMTTNLSGTPTNFQTIIYRILDDGTGRTITWGASFQAMGVDLPTTTTANKVLTVGFIYDTIDSKWGCVAVAEES